jgi:hypothetical protein
MKEFLLILSVLFVVASGNERKVPDKFLGEWNLERTENLDAYMIKRGEWFSNSFGKLLKIFQVSMCSSEKWSRLPVSLASISRTPTNPAHTTH